MLYRIVLTSVWAFESVDQCVRFSHEIEILDLDARDEYADSREHTKWATDWNKCIAAVEVVKSELYPMTGRLPEPLIDEPESDDLGGG